MNKTYTGVIRPLARASLLVMVALAAGYFVSVPNHGMPVPAPTWVTKVLAYLLIIVVAKFGISWTKGR